MNELIIMDSNILTAHPGQANIIQDKPNRAPKHTKWPSGHARMTKGHLGANLS